MTEDKKCGMTCPLTGCPVSKVLINTIVAFVVTMGFDMFFHGTYLKDAYEATASMWRSDEEMKQFFDLCILYHAVLAFGIGGLYAWISKNASCGGKCHKTGLKFGFFIGLILGVSHAASYIWMPIPQELALNWLGGTIVWGLLLGLALSLVCRVTCKKNCSTKDAK